MRFEEIPHNLIEQARDGDRHAMENLCIMVQPGAHAVILSLVRNEDDAADTLQNSLIRMIRFLPKLRKTPAFPGWLMRLLVNQAMTSFHGNSQQVIDITALPEASLEASVHSTASQAPSPRATAEGHELGERINRAMGELPARQRTAIALFEIEQMSIREIAESMELSEGAVKFHIHEARKTLRLKLQYMTTPPAMKERSAP